VILLGGVLVFAGSILGRSGRRTLRVRNEWRNIRNDKWRIWRICHEQNKCLSEKWRKVEESEKKAEERQKCSLMKFCLFLLSVLPLGCVAKVTLDNMNQNLVNMEYVSKLTAKQCLLWT
jgi:hypothetical protein